MKNLNWKLEKIKSLDNEVKELHPLLHEIFRSMPQLKSVYYTQGNREAGADFVLVKTDDLLDQDDYVGVVVKSTSLKQNHDDVARQIRECTAARPIEGGKKTIFLTEIWVVTSKEITRNAQDFLNLEYKTTKIKFIDGNALVALTEKYFPEYWEHLDASLGKYILDQRSKIEMLEVALRLLPTLEARLFIDQYIIRVTEKSKRKFSTKESTPTGLMSEITKRKAIFIEGGMGSGKSELLRTTALTLCERESINKYKMVPYFSTYRDLLDNPFYKNGSLIEHLKAHISDEAKDLVIFVDGFDEIQKDPLEKIKDICAFANLANVEMGVRIVVASRDIGEDALGQELAKSFDRYMMCQLTYGAMITVVESICDKNGVSNKLRDDLQKSPLMRALPRTPLSAILLGKLLKENINELPSTLPELYSKYIELVLGRWDIKKGNGSEKEYETIQRLISMIAVYTLDNDLDEISIGEVRAMFDEYLSARKTGQALDSMLTTFIDRSELIGYNRDAGKIRFKHRTFAEYFYAHAMLMEKGKDAPLNSPFAMQTYGIEYFYLGLIRDSAQRVESLSNYQPNDASEEFVKLWNFGSFLMAAYQTPYHVIQEALYKSFRDTALQFVGVIRGTRRDWLCKLPELQLLSLLTYIARQSFAYDFFIGALTNAKIEAELDDGLDDEKKIILIFLVDTVLSSLNDKDAFKVLVDRYEVQLSMAVRLGIKFSAEDVSFINDATSHMERKIKKTLKGNPGLESYLEALQLTPIEDRKDINQRATAVKAKL